MEEKKENLNNTNQSKSIYIILKKFGINIYKKITSSDEWLSIPIMLIVMLFAFGILMLYMNQFSYIFFANDENSWSTIVKEDHQIDKIEKLGQVGDFIGGALNPLFALFSFILLLMTVKIQNKALKNSQEELKLTREELKATRMATRDSATALKEQSNSIKLQNFENTFFSMISLHNEIINGLSIKSHFIDYDSKIDRVNNEREVQVISTFNNVLRINDGNSIFHKREVISYICDNFEKFMLDRFKDINEKKLKSEYSSSFTQRQNFKDYKINTYLPVNEIYKMCYKSYQDTLEHYFNNIYQILNFVSTSESKDKRKYSDLFRAQFSSKELKLLFYHCFSMNNIDNLIELLENFEFFKYLNIETNNENFLYIFHKQSYNDRIFGETNTNITLIKEVLKNKIQVINNMEENKKIYNLKDYKYYSSDQLSIYIPLLKENIKDLRPYENKYSFYELRDNNAKQIICNYYTNASDKEEKYVEYNL